MRRIFIISNFKLDLEEGTPPEMIMEDIIDAAQDNSTIYLSDAVTAGLRKGRDKVRYTYTLTIKEGLPK